MGKRRGKRGGRRNRGKRSRVAPVALDSLLDLPISPAADMPSIQGALDSSAWMFACAYRLAAAIATIPVRVENSRTKEEARGRKADQVRKVFRKINPEHTYLDFIEQNVIHLTTGGEAYIEKVRNGFGDVAELWCWNPEMVKPVPDGSGNRLVKAYTFSEGGKVRTLPADDVIAMRVYNPQNRLRGQSAITPIWDDVQGDRSAARYNRRLLDRGARVGGILQPTEQDLTLEEVRRLRHQMDLVHGGADNAGKHLVLPYGVSYERDSQTNKEMDFLGGRQFARETVAGIIGVPPLVIGNFDSANYANAREQLRAFWDYVGKPLMLRIFMACNEHWIHEEVDENLDAVPDMAAIDALVDNMTTRTENNTKAVLGTLITINEARRNLGYKPIPDGDKLLLPLNAEPVAPDKIETPEKPVPEPLQPGGDDEPDDEPEKDEDKSAHTKASASERAIMREAHGIALDRAEAQLAKAVEDFLRGQRSTYVERAKVSSDVDWIVGPAEEDERDAFAALSPVVLRIISDAGDLMLSRMGMGADPKEVGVYTRKTDGPAELPELISVLDRFGLNNPRVLSYMEQFFLKHVHDLNQQMTAAVRKSLEEGIAAGEGAGELALRLEELPGFATERAERMARTETAAAFNLGAMEAFKAARTPRKSWLSTRDGERVRVSHRRADERYSAAPIPVDEFFVLEQEGKTAEVLYPADPAGPGWASINCRCALVPEQEEIRAYWIHHCKLELLRHEDERVLA